MIAISSETKAKAPPPLLIIIEPTFCSPKVFIPSNMSSCDLVWHITTQTITFSKTWFFQNNLQSMATFRSFHENWYHVYHSQWKNHHISKHTFLEIWLQNKSVYFKISINSNLKDSSLLLQPHHNQVNVLRDLKLSFLCQLPPVQHCVITHWNNQSV